MRNLALALLAISLISITSVMADTYKATMTGIECSGCKKRIIKALGEMEGVESVRIAMMKKKGDHVLTVKTDGSAAITQEQATAVVAVAEHYQLKTWAKVEKK